MSFTEFESVPFKSEKMLQLKNEVIKLIEMDKSGARHKPIMILGIKGSGRRTLAHHLVRHFKSNMILSEVEITIDQIDQLNWSTQCIYFSDEIEFAKDFSKIFHVITLPILAERKDDLIALAEFHLQVLSLMNGRKSSILSDKAKEKILSYHWPQQFHELEKVLEKALTKSERHVIEPEDIELSDQQNELEFPLGLKLENIERQYILQTLFFVHQNRTKAAEVLGISIRTLRNKLNQYRQEGFL